MCIGYRTKLVSLQQSSRLRNGWEILYWLGNEPNLLLEELWRSHCGADAVEVKLERKATEFNTAWDERPSWSQAQIQVSKCVAGHQQWWAQLSPQCSHQVSDYRCLSLYEAQARESQCHLQPDMSAKFLGLFPYMILIHPCAPITLIFLK